MTLAPLLWLASAHASEVFDGRAFYLGDVHAHTNVSGDAASAGDPECADECGELDRIFETARQNDLSFVAFTDHVNGDPAGHPERYAALLDRIIAAHDPRGQFVTLPAAEVFFTNGAAPLGHKTLLMFGSDEEIDGFAMTDASPNGLRSDVESCDEIWTWMEELSTAHGPAILVPHHPGGEHPMPTDWICHDPLFQPVVEVYSKHGSSLEDGSDYDEIFSGFVDGATVTDAIDPQGHALQMGFVAATDRHDTRPGAVCQLDLMGVTRAYGGGLTIAVLDEDELFDRPALYEAFVDRRVYATSGPLVPVTVAYAVDGVVVGGLGDPIEALSGQTLRVSVTVPEHHAGFVTGASVYTPLGAAPMLSDGDATWHVDLPVDDVAYVYATVQVDGAAWYGTQGCEDGGATMAEWLWLSPSWIQLRVDVPGVTHTRELEELPVVDTADVSAPDGACGCGSVPDASWLLALLAPVIATRRTRRTDPA